MGLPIPQRNENNRSKPKNRILKTYVVLNAVKDLRTEFTANLYLLRRCFALLSMTVDFTFAISVTSGRIVTGLLRHASALQCCNNSKRLNVGNTH